VHVQKHSITTIYVQNAWLTNSEVIFDLFTLVLKGQFTQTLGYYFVMYDLIWNLVSTTE